MKMDDVQRVVETKEIVNEGIKFLVTNDIIKASDILEGGNDISYDAMKFITKALDLCYDIMNDCYKFMETQSKNVETLVKENEELKRINVYQTELLKDIIEEIKKDNKKVKPKKDSDDLPDEIK